VRRAVSLLLLLLLLLGAHAAGIVWADSGRPPPPAFGALAALVLASGIALCLGAGIRRQGGAQRRLRAAACLALAGCAFGGGELVHRRTLERARADAALAAVLEPDAIQLVDARVRMRRSTGFGEEVELVEVRARSGAPAVPAQLLLSLPPAATGPISRAARLLWPGARVRLAVRIAPLRPARNPGSPDREHALARRGLGARARLVKPDWVAVRAPRDDRGAAFASGAAGLRSALLERVRLRLAAAGTEAAARPGVAGAGLVRALALGDRRDVADATGRAFRQLGLSHLVSVSGLHIGFVAWPAAWAVAQARVRLRGSRRPVHGFAAPLIAACAAGGCYAWLAGASVPALRASLGFALVGAARGLGFTLSPGPSLAAVALLLLVADPADLFDPGAWFSFTACAALVAGGIWRRSGRTGAAEPPAAVPGTTAATGPPAAARSAPRSAALVAASSASLSASLAVSLGMLPLIELQGLPRALISPAVNTLAIPFTGFVVMPCAFAASALAALLPAGVGDALLEWLVLPAAGLESAAVALAQRTPAAWIGEDTAGRLAWPLALASIAAALAGLRRGRWLGAAIVWIVLAGLGLSSLPQAALGGARPRVVFFDVGQADAALVETADAVWLIDTGAGSPDGRGGGALVRALRAEGIARLDRLVVTHGDLDHRGGAARLLAAMPVGALWLPELPTPDPALEALAGQATAAGVAVRRVAAGDQERPGDRFEVAVLWPPRPRPGARPRGRSPGSPRNDASLVLRLALGDRRLLFTGDVGLAVERALLAAPESLRSDLLKVAHHGSRASSQAAFVAAVGARVAVLSAPCAGARGLPSADALARLRAAGARLLWTGRDGAVRVSAAEGAPLVVRTWGRRRVCPGDGP